jgi:signal transduction histidine kinase
VYGEVSERQSAAIQNIIERTHHLTRLINDLLLQTQIEAGEFSLYNEPFSPYELVKRVGKTLRPLAQIKDLSYHARIDASMPNLLNGDPDRITQIMLNLVENAIKFTDHGEVNLHITPDGSHWSIQVSDTGIGIPIEVQSKLFQAFEQANYKITRETGGFGLGLSIVRELATIMGGKVELESAEGSGSKITVTLPLEPIEETAQ